MRDFSCVAHDLGASIAIVQIMAKAHHAAGAQIVERDALGAFAAGRVRDGLNTLGATGASQYLDARRQGVGDEDGDIGHGGGGGG